MNNKELAAELVKLAEKVVAGPQGPGMSSGLRKLVQVCEQEFDNSGPAAIEAALNAFIEACESSGGPGLDRQFHRALASNLRKCLEGVEHLNETSSGSY